MSGDDHSVDELTRENAALRAALNAKQESDFIHRTLIASIPQKLFLKDRKSIYLAANHAYATSLGCNVEDVVGKDDFAFFPKELAEEYRAADQAVIDSGNRQDFEERYIAQGKEYWIQTTKAPVKNDSGEVSAVLGLFEDITERRRAEMALNASESRYRRLFEAAKDGILILDAETGQVVDVNPYLVDLTGHTREEFLGRRLWDLGPFRDVTASTETFRTLQRDGYVRYDDLPLRASDGRRLDVEFVSNVYDVGDGRVIQCNIRDISERKRGQLERERLTTAIDQASEIVLVTDAAGDIIYANPAFETVTGYTRSEVLGRNPRLLKSGVQDEAFYHALWARISGGHTWHGRIVNKKKDGSLFTSDATISPVRDATGTTTSYVTVQRDITSELELEAQLLQAQKMEGVGRLAGGVAHDFNNLLTVILSYTRFALEQLREGDPLRDDLQEIERAGERAADLTRQLLAFSRKQVLQPVRLDLNEILANMDKMLRRIIGEDIDVALVQAPDLGPVMADRGQIEQVLMNLVVNARDAMRTGGKLTVETANVELDDAYVERHLGAKAGPYVMLAVSDTGSGMDRETRARIFDPFFTTKDKEKGTGLGLSTVYGIIKQSGGNIFVYSEPGLGTTFKIYLPRLLTDSTAPVVQSVPEPRRSGGGETILVVEDEAALREVIRRSLQSADFEVVTAGSGAEALGKLHDYAVGTIDLVLTDVVMPKMSGGALVRELAKLGRTARILYMSGYSDEAIVQHGVLEPGTHFLSKPFTPADLVRKVRDVLNDSGEA